MLDVAIRGGELIDGSGGRRRRAELGIEGGRVVEIGAHVGRAHRELDARGALVTPGFVDVHTHYDGQATWDSRLAPSSLHGVTTVVLGNCGVGFAPCRERDRGALISLMEGVEDIPGTALAEGLPWNWESFGEYLDALGARARDVDVAAFLAHGPLRVYVMGERAIRREPATATDILAMRAGLEQALDAGAVGFSTSRTLAHRTASGDFTPMYQSARDELTGIGAALRGRGRRIFQLISDFGDADAEYSILHDVAAGTGCTANFTLVQSDYEPDGWHKRLRQIENSQSRGVDVRGQVIARPIGVLMGHSASMHPFSSRPSYRELAELPLVPRLRRLREPAVRARILAESDQTPHIFMQLFGRLFDRFFVLGEQPDYLPDPRTSIASRAAERGVSPQELLYDLLLEDEGRALVYVPVTNFCPGYEAAILAMLRHPFTLPALGDGGAHVGTIADASACTFLLTEWVRRRAALTPEAAIHLLTARPAQLFSFDDRGTLAVGRKADVNVIALEELAIERPVMHYDLPAGGRRFLQRARGYRYTLVNGEVTYEDGQATAALPGRLVRRH